ncbi:unconventional myosin-Va-like isoform X3 [Crassostrea angulata]|uniref:unconventional myosin-Va-like isoform X3 n=1 Tax=Magallana angulata TaxID=2784310 RepID=UPI0022B08BF7|nr:unconventional myosin-Va-like isoform X3 [Crassostrea angulata]
MTSAELYVQTFLKDSEISQVYVKGARIWVPDEEKVWVGAELLENYTGQKTIRIQIEDSAEERDYAIKDKKRLPHLRNPEILIGENDLTSLSYLNEPEVLYNLQVRFLERNCIYTYCGIVLVAINPYQQLPIYGNELIQMYSGQDMGTMDPHIFAVAEEAFKLMSRFDKNQSIIVSGESGAGKTVSAKYAMRYFAMVGGSQAETQVEQKVLASNPIMEAIGNAKTTRNDNSSRFGKYIEISFSKNNAIIGAHMRTYLLEKSRVVFQAAEERNYHIFYQLCASRDRPEFKKFCLMSPDDFYYTSHGMAPEIDGVDDAEDMLSARDALTMLGITEKDQMMIFQIQSAVLHFGNVKIREADGESSEIKKDDKHLSIMCKLLGIEESQMRMWLCHKKIVTVGEVLTKPLTLTQASFAQDALAKHIYAQTFNWIVEKINRALHSNTKSTKFIGVLDIYGFETFEVNSFEQFCINYANEKLQQIFNMHVFKLEQEEYVREAIEWSFIDFYDNQPCIDLIESKLGILDLLDEECKMPKGSDENWCQKLYDKHLGKAKHFEKPRMSRSAFIINHFADRVEYQADGFLEKNRDTVLEDHINILRASEFELVAELFEEKVDPNEKKSRAGSATTHPMRQAPKGGRSNKKTVGSQFRESLKKLMETLNATTPHYIRCIKPNDIKEAFIFDPKRAVEQLRACGVLETIRISAAGYPSRWTYPEFFQRYRVLARSKDINRSDHKKTCENVLTKVIQGSVKKTPRGLEDPDKYRFGKTKIFFRAGQVAYLEKLRSDKLKACGIMIQKHVKGWLARRRYQRITKSVTLLQKYGRGLLARRHAKFLRETFAATRIQKQWKGYRARREYVKVRKATVVIQSAIRGYFGRMLFKQELHEHRAITIQKMVRSYLARRRYKRVMRGIVLLQSHYRRRRAKKQLKVLKIEAKSVEHIKNVNKGLENKIIQLQQRLDAKNKEGMSIKEQEVYIKQLKGELEKLRSSNEEGKRSSNKVSELMQQIKDLQEELSREREEKQVLITKSEEMVKEHTQMLSKLAEEKCQLKEQLEEASLKLQQQETKTDDEMKKKLEETNALLAAEFDSERSHHQRLVKEHARLQQRLENLQSEMAVMNSPGGHKRTPSDISAISLESYTSSVSPDEVKYDDEGPEEKDQGYGTKKKKKAPAPPAPTANAMEKEMKNVDIGLVLKLQNKVKELERQRTELEEKLERYEEETPQGTTDTAVISDSAFNALKQQLVNADDVQLVIKLQKRVAELEMTKSKLADELDEREDEDEDKSGFKITTPEFAYNNLKMQELQNENDKLKREVNKLMKSISENVSFERGGTNSPAGKEFMDAKVEDQMKAFREQFTAMSDELERRREECLQLRAMLAEKSITTHAIAKESYGGMDDIVNEDNELALAYRTQKELNRLLENQLQKTEKDAKKKEDKLKREIRDLKHENEAAQKVINQYNSITRNLQLGPEAKIEATMQHEITRLTSENLDLREKADKQSDQIRKLKKMLKVYAKKLKDGDVAEIEAELERDDKQKKSDDGVATVKHLDRTYMGMLEYKKEDEAQLIKCLILDLKPKLAQGLLPGLPSYLLFMCVRHTDYINDDEKVRTLLTNTINGIKKCVKKHSKELDRVIMWLANTCRLLHTLKQYSGEKAFQSENTPRQNEHCLRNFDLSEYRQVFSDLAVWIYQTMIKYMEEVIQPMVVSALLEHEAIAGLTASKPAGMRGRSSSSAHEEEGREFSLDSLVKALNKYVQILSQHAVDPELVKQVFRQLYYYIGSNALNNLLLRKDMCNWSKGMQIRYNLSHLEQWLRDNKLNESGAQSTLEPITQASQLLQARKSDADVDSICEMCSKLTTPQIVKILNLYTPVDEFEERVPISFIRKIQERLKSVKREEGEDNTLLMDTKFTFPVTFPFNPSSVTLDSIDIPESLHLDFLTRV